MGNGIGGTMRLGLLADIHEEIGRLKAALVEFQSRGVDQVVSLGDACDTYSPAVGRAAEVAALLRRSGAVGVWGNHDIGLCHEVCQTIRSACDPETLEFMGRMRPWLSLAGCRISHVDPWVDATRAEEIWFLGGPPDTPEKVALSFSAVPDRHLFVGHFHRWLIMTPAGRVEWDPSQPIALDSTPRSFVVVAAVVDGWCATFDTDTSTLTPIRLV